MQNIQTWTPVALVLLQHRNKGARVLFHPSIGLGFNREQQKQFAEPHIIDSELNSAFGDSRRADEHPVLAVGLLQFLWCHRPTRNVYLNRMFYMPNQQGCMQANVPPRGVADAVFLTVPCSVTRYTEYVKYAHCTRICKINRGGPDCAADAGHGCDASD